MPPQTIQDLTSKEAAFLTAMQNLGFGRFEYLQIRSGEIVLSPAPVVVRDIKFATPPKPVNPAPSSSALKPQVTEFFSAVRRVECGEVRQLVVHHGLPFSMQIEISGGHFG